MIEDKTIGLKVAEDENEAYWTRIRDSTIEDIKRLKDLVKFQEAVLVMVKGKLKPYDKPNKMSK